MLTCAVIWRNAAERLPAEEGQYVVEVQMGSGLRYRATRGYRPAHSAWTNMLHGERVTYWLEGLRTPAECDVKQA